MKARSPRVLGQGLPEKMPGAFVIPFREGRAAQTGQRRNRVFAYDHYLAILNEGTEPL